MVLLLAPGIIPHQVAWRMQHRAFAILGYSFRTGSSGFSTILPAHYSFCPMSNCRYCKFIINAFLRKWLFHDCTCWKHKETKRFATFRGPKGFHFGSRNGILLGALFGHFWGRLASHLEYAIFVFYSFTTIILSIQFRPQPPAWKNGGHNPLDFGVPILSRHSFMTTIQGPAGELERERMLKSHCSSVYINLVI